MNKTSFFRTLLVFLALAAVPQNVQSQSLGGNIVANNDTCRIIDRYLTQLAAEKDFSGGLLIIRDGRKVLCKGYGQADREKQIPFTPSTPASMGSITKAFTAAGILKLAEQGKLSVADPLSRFFRSPDNL